jgi:hypothetical protein
MIAARNDPEARREIVTALRLEISTLSPADAQAIRTAYYAIADNLRPLADMLEKADSETGSSPGRLLVEHFKVCDMLNTFERVDLAAAL